MSRMVWLSVGLLVAGLGGCDDRRSATDTDADGSDGVISDASPTDAIGPDAGRSDAGEVDASSPCDEVRFEVEDDGAVVCPSGFSLHLWERGSIGGAWRWRLGGQCDEALMFIDVDVPDPPPPQAFLPERLLGSYTTGLTDRASGTSRWLGGRDETDDDGQPLGQLVAGEAHIHDRCFRGSARLTLVPPSTDNVDGRPSVDATLRWRGPSTPLQRALPQSPRSSH